MLRDQFMAGNHGYPEQVLRCAQGHSKVGASPSYHLPCCPHAAALVYSNIAAYGKVMNFFSLNSSCRNFILLFPAYQR